VGERRQARLKAPRSCRRHDRRTCPTESGCGLSPAARQAITSTQHL